MNPEKVNCQNLVHKEPSCHWILFQVDEPMMVTIWVRLGCTIFIHSENITSESWMLR